MCYLHPKHVKHNKHCFVQDKTTHDVVIVKKQNFYYA